MNVKKKVFNFLINKFNVEHISLRYTTCYFDTFTYCNKIADVVILIILHNYSTVLSLYYSVH